MVITEFTCTLIFLVITVSTENPSWAVAAGLFAIACNLNGILNHIKGD